MATTVSTSDTSQDRLIVGFAALAVAIHVLETAIPSPLPGLRPGLANVITLIVLFRYGWRMAAWVTLLRVVGASLLIGTFLTPAFALSLAGGLATLLIFATFKPLIPFGLGPLGMGAMASLAHIGGQLALAWLVFIPHPGLWSLAPVLFAVGLPLGIISGLITVQTLKWLDSPQTGR